MKSPGVRSDPKYFEKKKVERGKNYGRYENYVGMCHTLRSVELSKHIGKIGIFMLKTLIKGPKRPFLADFWGRITQIWFMKISEDFQYRIWIINMFKWIRSINRTNSRAIWTYMCEDIDHPSKSHWIPPFSKILGNRRGDPETVYENFSGGFAPEPPTHKNTKHTNLFFGIPSTILENPLKIQRHSDFSPYFPPENRICTIKFGW